MTEDFKRRLAAYEKGELSGDELIAFEKELEKLEHYQDILEIGDNGKDPGTTLKTLNDNKNQNDPKNTNTEQSKHQKSGRTYSEKHFWQDDQKQRKILRKGKWRARIQTALFAIVLLILVTIVSSILTALYYEWGSSRGEIYRDVIEYSMTLTNPYGSIGGTGANVKPFFGMKVERDINKQVGHDFIEVGTIEVNFILSLMGHPIETYHSKQYQDQPLFFYPGEDNNEFESDWERLEKLPEGTVASAYISFTDLVDTGTAFDYLENKDLELIWLAVDSGVELDDEWYDGVVFHSFGFPAYPIWHDDDFVLVSREEQKGFLRSEIISEGYSSPEYEVGDYDILHTQFLKTVNFLKKYERKAEKFFYGDLGLAERLQYIEKNGIKHYGFVITGPTKEILTLKDEPWINVMQIDEVELWNWQTFEE